MVVGVDEVGRGCWAGPLVVGIVGLGKTIDGIKDSKLLSKARRSALSSRIYDLADAAALGWVWPQEIDNLGLTQATTLAIERALKLLNLKPTKILIDGNYNYLPSSPISQTVIGGDRLFPCISAASIIAKVARDNYMEQMAESYPNYGFEKHVGYGTKMHLQNIKTHGVCELHRRSFQPIKSLIAI